MFEEGYQFGVPLGPAESSGPAWAPSVIQPVHHHRPSRSFTPPCPRQSSKQSPFGTLRTSSAKVRPLVSHRLTHRHPLGFRRPGAAMGRPQGRRDPLVRLPLGPANQVSTQLPRHTLSTITPRLNLLPLLPSVTIRLVPSSPSPRMPSQSSRCLRQTARRPTVREFKRPSRRFSISSRNL